MTLLARKDQSANNSRDKPVAVEIKTFQELQAALDVHADIIMLDELSLEDAKKAVALTQRRAKIEISGNVAATTIGSLTKIALDYISSGALTKHINALDLSMRIQD